MNKKRLYKVSSAIFYGVFLNGSFAVDQDQFNERICNATPLQGMIGKALATCLEEEVSHGAYIGFDFQGELDVLRERILKTSMLEKTTVQSQEEPTPPLAKTKDVKVKDLIISQEIIKSSFAAAHHVLSISDSEAKIKISPVAFGYPRTLQGLLQKNILILKYLMASNEVKVATLCFDFPLLFDPRLMDSLEGQMFLDTLENFVKKDKLLIVGIGEEISSFCTQPYLNSLGKFLQNSSVGNRIILVGATTGGEQGESFSQFSRKPGMLKDYIILAPGSSALVAACVVSAAVLTLINQFPTLIMDEIRTIVFKSASPDGVIGGRDFLKEISSHGFLDVDSARLLCHEKSQSKVKALEGKSLKKAVRSIKSLCKHSKDWGSVYTTPHEGDQFWLPDEGMLLRQEEQHEEERLYFPPSISPDVLFPYPLKPGFVQAFYLEKADVSHRSLTYFGVEDDFGNQKGGMKGLIVGYRYYNPEKDISIIVYPRLTSALPLND